MREHVRELALFVAPSVNSYKRYAPESWAPTSVSWGRDNRTCGFRIVGHGQSRRIECRIPGADANPYLAFAALLAAGLDGIENKTDPGPELKGNAYEAGKAEAFPSSLREAVDLWEKSKFAKKAFGDAVHEHYLNYGRLEQDLFDKVVTDYERTPHVRAGLGRCLSRSEGITRSSGSSSGCQSTPSANVALRQLDRLDRLLVVRPAADLEALSRARRRPGGGGSSRSCARRPPPCAASEPGCSVISCSAHEPGFARCTSWPSRSGRCCSSVPPPRR